MAPLRVGLICVALTTSVAFAQNAADQNPPDAAQAETGPSEPIGAPTAAPRPAAEKSRIPEAAIASAPLKETRVITHHHGGPGLPDYTSTAGTLTLRDPAGKPIASMFYVAYTVDGGNPAHRPLTFFYNGGPGSSSLWMHVGSLGPTRVRTSSPDATGNPPFDIEPNDESLIDRTDMVYLDAIGTGFSRVVGDSKADRFWGVDSDIQAFTQGILRYLTINGRWNSPKFLFGESYGTTRSAGLSHALAEHGVQLNGVILLSSILNYGIRSPGFDRTYVGYLPSFAAAAWYHHKLAHRPDDLPSFLDEVRAWAGGPYLAALTKGQDLSPEETNAIAQKMSDYTGLSVTYLKESHLRVSPFRFRKELLRDERRTLGRYDTRFTGIDADDAGETPEFDASETGIKGAFVATLQTLLRDELHYPTEMTYLPTSAEIIKAWDWHHKVGEDTETAPDVALDLCAAMRENPHLKVLSLNGWYDLATPFYETEYDLKHMYLDEALRKNLSFAYYPSGHMVYLNPEALKQLHADVVKFYDQAAPR